MRIDALSQDLTSASGSGAKRAREEGESDAFNCSICFEILREPVTTLCGHNFDRGCLERHLAANVGRTATCPLCRKGVGAALPEVNTVLRDAVAHMFPQRLAQRVAAEEAEARKR